MADNLYTSDRLCRVITQNFREDHELKLKLRALEVKRRRALVRIILKTLEIERDLGPLVLRQSKNKVQPSRPQRINPPQSRGLLYGGPFVNRRAINEKSYHELIEYRWIEINRALTRLPGSGCTRDLSDGDGFRLPRIYKKDIGEDLQPQKSASSVREQVSPRRKLTVFTAPHALEHRGGVKQLVSLPHTVADPGQDKL